jgi:23S rRNA (uracil1939-C5)-methyltransferase
VRHCEERKANADYDTPLMVGLVINGNKLPQSDAFVSCLLETGLNISGIFTNTNVTRGNCLLGDTNKWLWGADKLHVTLGRLTFGLSPLSFFQVHYGQCAKLYDKAIECAALTGNETLWDLYCGTGTIALYAADRAKKVIGIECVADAVADARQNATSNGIQNTEFYTGNAEDIFPKIYDQETQHSAQESETDNNNVGATASVARCDGPHVVILDPPRSGCNARLLDAILQVSPDRIIYVSCDPATLARDIKILCADGQYSVQKITAVDMFPQTSHVETVCLMMRDARAIA